MPLLFSPTASSRAGFPALCRLSCSLARLLQLLYGHGTAAPSPSLEVVWVMGGDPLRIHTDTLSARNGVVNPLQSVLETVLYICTLCSSFPISCCLTFHLSAVSQDSEDGRAAVWLCWTSLSPKSMRFLSVQFSPRPMPMRRVLRPRPGDYQIRLRFQLLLRSIIFLPK